MILELACVACCRDLDEKAATYAAMGLHDKEINLRTYAIQESGGDRLDWYCLAAALRDAGYPVTSWFEEVAATTPPWDPVLQYTLDVLAEDSADPAQARAAEAHADYLREMFDGRTTAQGNAPHPPSSPSPAPAEGPDW